MTDSPETIKQPHVKIMARHGNEVVCVGRARLPGPYDPPLMIRDSDGMYRIIADPRGAHIIEDSLLRSSPEGR